jgi:hypothetical protein
VRLALLACPKWERLPVLVTVTRFSAGHIDSHLGGIGAALKSVIDEIAEWLPLAKKRGPKGTLRADDSDPQVTWKGEQAKCARGTHFVTARFEPREEP